MRISDESIQQAVDRQERFQKRHEKLGALLSGLLTGGLNPALLKEVESLERLNQEERSWQSVTQKILFDRD